MPRSLRVFVTRFAGIQVYPIELLALAHCPLDLAFNSSIVPSCNEYPVGIQLFFWCRGISASEQMSREDLHSHDGRSCTRLMSEAVSMGTWLVDVVGSC